MISEREEPHSFSKTLHGGAVVVEPEPTSARPSRPYAGADDSMDEFLGTTNMTQNQSPSKMPKPELLVGDLVWSKIPGHAWWPSMVSYEPNKAVYFQSSGRGKTCFKYHVQFFGDEPQRGWVSDKNMIKFTGRDPFMELPTSVVSKRDKIPHSKQLRAWERALEQAQKALPLNRQQRKLCYVFKYNDDLPRGPKPSKSPELAPKKKEKSSKKPTKIRSRVTRRSCLLDKSKENVNENDFGENTGDSENLGTNVTLLQAEEKDHAISESDSPENNYATADVTNSPERVAVRRRGRSAGSFAIDRSFMFDAVRMGVPQKLKEDDKDNAFISISKGDIVNKQIDAVDEIKDVKIADEKFNVTKMTASYSRKGQGMTKKRQRESGKEHMIKPPKKIKVEIVTRKPHIFEIIPKKMKNKQTQTPERKTKKGVTSKKGTKRKIDFSRRAIKTKETSASKKFSRKLAVPCRKGVRSRRHLSDGGHKREAVSKQAVKIRKGANIPTKTTASNEEIADVEDDNVGEDFDKGSNDVVVNQHAYIADIANNESSVTSEKEPVEKRKRGRPRSKSKSNEKFKKVHNECLAEAVVESTEDYIENADDGNGSPQETTRKMATRLSDRFKNETVTTRQLRGSTITIPIVEEKKSLPKLPKKAKKIPSRRSTRSLVSSDDADPESVVVCKVSQLPEIDDIVEGDSSNGTRINGIINCINKGLLLEVLSNINAEIPIELEGIEQRDEETTCDSIKDCDKNDAEICISSISKGNEVCSDSDPLPNDVVSPKPSSDCAAANQESSDTLALYEMNGQIVDDYLHVRSDENLSTCSVMETTDKRNGHENDDFAVSWSVREKIDRRHHINTAEKTYLPISNNSDLLNDRVHDGGQAEACKGDNLHHCTKVDDIPPVTTHIDDNQRMGPCTSTGYVAQNHHHLHGLLNAEQSSEYGNTSHHHHCDQQRNNPSMFPSGGLNGVEDTDLYLNDDDIGLPASKSRTSCAFSKCGIDSFATSYGKEIEPLSMLSKITCSEADFCKPNQLDVNGLDEFQPVFTIPTLSLPDLSQPVPYYQKRLYNPCSVISALPGTTMHIDHISSNFFHTEDSLASTTVTSVPCTQIVASGHLDRSSHLQPVSSHDHLCVESAVMNHPIQSTDQVILGTYGIASKGYSVTPISRDVFPGSSCMQQANRQTDFEDVTVNMVNCHSSEPLQSHEIEHCTPRNHKLNSDKNISLSTTELLHSVAQDQPAMMSECNGSVDGKEGIHKQQDFNRSVLDLPVEEDASLPLKESPTNLQSHVTSMPQIKNSPEMCETSDCYAEQGNDCDGSVATHGNNGMEKNEVVDADSATISANSSMSEVQSPSEISREAGQLDSPKISDDCSSQVGNSVKRQRKRKAMSDFHVGLAFDEILSNRGRTSDTDKGVPKLSLTKKKRDSIRRIDFEEKFADRSKPSRDGEAVLSAKDEGPLEENQNGGKIVDAYRCGKSSVNFNEDNAEGESSMPCDVSHEKNTLDKTGVELLDEVADPIQCSLTEVSIVSTVGTKEKKKRGRKPKEKNVKNGREKNPVGKKTKKSPQKSKKATSVVLEDTRESTERSEGVNDEEFAEGRKDENRTNKKFSLKLKLSKNLKSSDGDGRMKRKYVKRKEAQQEKLPQEVSTDQVDIEGTAENNVVNNLNKSISNSKADQQKEYKPKRKYKKKKTNADILVSKSESIFKMKTDEQKNKKTKKKGKREEILEEPAHVTIDPTAKQPRRKKRMLQENSEPMGNDGPVEQLFSVPKKYRRRKTSLTDKGDDESVKTVETKTKRRTEGSLAEDNDTDRTSAGIISDDEHVINGNLVESKIDRDINFERPSLSSLDLKRTKRNEKLETRSNISDETASISGRENEESGKNKKESICTVCEQGDGLLACNGVCYSSFHPDCLGLSTVPEKFYCDECLTGNHSCFLCKETGNLRKCSYATCGKFYHEDCTQKLRGCKLENNRLTCSLHSCGTCSNDKESSSNSKKRLLRCVRCPTAYHASGCLVAGCLQLTNTLMVCNKHFVPHKSKPHHTHYNVSWCFVCSTGGMLVCCDSCPAAFHPGCVEDLNGVPDEAWQCDSCREGKKPLYGDLVWVKYGFWRWWPARICFPDEIPSRIQSLSHDVGEFPVMFFGSRDYCWLHAGRVFPYQEGDKGCRGSSKSGTNKIFEKAIREVEEAHKELKEMQDKQLEQRLAKQSRKPPSYKQIKVNKYISAIRNVIDQSEFTHCECLPTSDNPCGPGSECINRMLQIECDKTCKALEKCLNQRFQKCQQADCVPFKTAHCGWGLKTRQNIKKGDFVIEYVGELIDEATCRKRINEYHDQGISDYYFLVIDKDNIIDAYPKGNASRFMNHCCDPNCDTQKWTVNGEIRVGLFANKDIEAGNELTFNYNLDTLGNEKKICHCGSRNCSGFLGVRPKTQTALALKEKKKKEKQKKKKKKDKTKLIRHEDECFVCGDGGELIMCDRTSCSKCYHLKCLTLSDMPKGKWDCPWHFCDICGKRASFYCTICPNSFCGPHHEGEVLEISDGVYVCDEHSEDEIKAEKDRLLVLSKGKEAVGSLNDQSHVSQSSSEKDS